MNMQSIKGAEQRVFQPRMPESTRTSSGLRDILFDEIEELRRGTGDIKRAAAIAKLAGQIIASARLDVDYSLAVDGKPVTAVKSLPLGK